MPLSTKQKIILWVTTIFIVIFLGLYKISFNIGGYDILIENRRNQNKGYGINYKNGFELSRFAENQHGGVAERRIFPK